MNTRRILKLKYKLIIIKETQRSGNIRATARKYNVRTQQIRRWRRRQSRMLETIKENPEAKKVNRIKSQNTDVKHRILESLKKLEDIAINTKKIIATAVDIEEEESKLKSLIDGIDELNI